MSVRKITMITSFRWLEVDAPSGVYQLMPTVNIIVGKERIRKYLTEDLKAAAGWIEYSHFIGSDHLVVSLDEEQDCWDSRIKSGQHALKIWMTFLDWALQDSWLVEDNCFICEIAYCRFQTKQGVEWSNNGLFGHASSSDGRRDKTVKWSMERITEWAERGLSLRDHLHGKGYDSFADITSKEVNRFARFLQFVKSARRESTPAIKIAQMCTALESLFATSTGELTHRLSERVALFLGGSADEMEDSYRLIKKAYAIRSQVTHGSPISKSVAGSVTGLSEDLLNKLRMIVLKILEEGNHSVVYGSDESIEAYFRRSLFDRR